MKAKFLPIASVVIAIGLAWIGYNEWSRSNLQSRTKILTMQRAAFDTNALSKPKPKTLQEVVAGAAAAADFLKRSVQEDGRFTYRIDAHGDHTQFLRRLNWARQLSALHAMAIYDDDNPSPSMRTALVRGLRYAVKTRLHKVDLPGPPQSAIFRDTREGGWSKVRYFAELRSTALGLLAALKVNAKVPGAVSKRTLIEMGRFLQSMQKNDGSFFSHYDPSSQQKQDQAEFLHPPSEAILALTRLYEDTRDKSYLSTALKGLRYLALSRAKRATVPTDNWSLTASEALLNLKGAEISEADRKLILTHAIQVLKADLRDQVTDVASENYGSFFLNRIIVPSSSRVEGLLAGLRFLPATPELSDLRKDIRQTVDQGMIYLYECQLHDGPYQGAVAKSVNSSDLRIDYTASALVAMQGYIHLLRSVD